MIANFMSKHSDASLNGIPLDQAIAAEFAGSFDEYLEKQVIKDHVDASNLILVIAPIVLRTNITIMNVNENHISKAT